MKKAGSGRKLTEAQVKNRIRKLFKDAQLRLGLDRYIFELGFGPLVAPDEDRVCLAEITVSWEYKDAQITFDAKQIAEYRLGPILHYIVRHEMCHVITAPMSDMLDKMWDYYSTAIQEMETSHIERLPLWGDDTEV